MAAILGTLVTSPGTSGFWVSLDIVGASGWLHESPVRSPCLGPAVAEDICRVGRDKEKESIKHVKVKERPPPFLVFQGNKQDVHSATRNVPSWMETDPERIHLVGVMRAPALGLFRWGMKGIVPVGVLAACVRPQGCMAPALHTCHIRAGDEASSLERFREGACRTDFELITMAFSLVSFCTRDNVVGR